MYKRIDRKAIKAKKHYRIRKNISGSADCPRLVVYRSNKNIYAQLIDDVKGVTLAAVSTLEGACKDSYGGNIAAAERAGQLLAEKATQAGINCAVFDRGGLLYHGRIAALAEGARKGGLQF